MVEIEGKIPGEPAKRFHVYIEGSNNEPVVPPQASYDTVDEVLKHYRHQGHKYMVSVDRKTMKWDEFVEWAKNQKS